MYTTIDIPVVRPNGRRTFVTLYVQARHTRRNRSFTLPTKGANPPRRKATR